MFDTVIVHPMLNFLLWLYGTTGSFVLAITIFTVLTRLIVLPVTVQQQRNSQKMQALGPRVKEIQDKYKNDPVKMQDELGKIGYGPGMLLSGCLPMIVQLVILWGLWQAITRVLATSPLSLLDLVQSIYKWLPGLVRLVPVGHQFLWLDLSQRDPTYVLPVLVAVSTYFSQKAFTPAVPADQSSAAMTRQMQIMMPGVLGFMALSFPSALSLYWVLSNLLAVVQYYGLQRTGVVPKPVPPPAGLKAAPAGNSPPAAPSGPPPPISTQKPRARARKIRSRKS